jgi:xanthine dehydrogenase YagS FAD-binding subunit
MAVALTALDARVTVRGARGERTIPISSFYRLPGNSPHIETDLQPGELITGVEIPVSSEPATGSHYVKIRDRNSYGFALVSAAAIVTLDAGERIREARIALGSVAPKPWRVAAAEEALRGSAVEADAFRRAAEILTEGAQPREHNAFKVEMAKRATVRALFIASGRS